MKKIITVPEYNKEFVEVFKQLLVIGRLFPHIPQVNVSLANNIIGLLETIEEGDLGEDWHEDFIKETKIVREWFINHVEYGSDSRMWRDHKYYDAEIVEEVK